MRGNKLLHVQRLRFSSYLSPWVCVCHLSSAFHWTPTAEGAQDAWVVCLLFLQLQVGQIHPWSHK